MSCSHSSPGTRSLPGTRRSPRCSSWPRDMKPPPTGPRVMARTGMTADADHLEQARKVADAILYEGYLLYPYRQSSQKNKSRFQFGVLMPAAYGAIDPTEPSASQTQCLVECGDDSRVQVLIRFLQLRRRRVEEATGSGELREVPALTVDGIEHTCWDEAVERNEHVAVGVAELTGGELADGE